jgi:hypothetical protein
MKCHGLSDIHIYQKYGNVPSQLRLAGSIASPAASGSSGGEDSRGREGGSGGEDSIASSSEAIGCRGGVGGDISRAVDLVVEQSVQPLQRNFHGGNKSKVMDLICRGVRQQSECYGVKIMVVTKAG